MTNIELLKKINEHLEFLMDCTIEPSDVRSSTKQLMDEIKSTICNSKSNGDMIRQMTDEELAVFLNTKTLGLTSVCDVPCEIYDVTGHCFVSECYDAFLKWLKKEADE